MAIRQIDGIIRVWYGKLAAPLHQVKLGKIDRETFQKYQAGEPVTSPIRLTQRRYGMCVEMRSGEVLKAYETHPYHKVRTDAYERIRVDGTTTFNIPGQ